MTSRCPYDPTDDPGGMIHCPLCGEMVLPGLPHPDYDRLEAHLKAVSNLRFGDLVVLQDGQYALVVDPLVDAKSLFIQLYQGNGLEVNVEWTEILDVVTLPGSEAHVNFAEFMIMSRT